MIHLRRNVCFVIFTLVLMLTVSCGQSNVESFEYLPETSVGPQYSETEEDSEALADEILDQDYGVVEDISAQMGTREEIHDWGYIEHAADYYDLSLTDMYVEKEEETPPKGYVAPEGWYEPRFCRGKVSGGDYKLQYGVMGLKVYKAQKYFGLRPYTWGYYKENLMDEVAYFQGKNGLAYTGTVNLETWLAMGFSEKEWNELGTYVSPIRISPSFTRDEIIDEFLARAKEYLGTPYVVGASGKPGEGVDCSGLVLQCLYSIGIYPDGIDPVQHSTLEEYNSRLMWNDPKFKQIWEVQLKPGDLVFYRNPGTWTVVHVGIYLGNGQVIEALYSKVEILPLHKTGKYDIFGCKRVIAD